MSFDRNELSNNGYFKLLFFPVPFLFWLTAFKAGSQSETRSLVSGPFHSNNKYDNILIHGRDFLG